MFMLADSEVHISLGPWLLFLWVMCGLFYFGRKWIYN